MSGSTFHPAKPDTEITLEDILVTTPLDSPETLIAGQFGSESADEKSEIVLDRLYNQIDDMVKKLIEDRKITPKDDNHVIRLMTNEFFFYTKKPLEMKEFETLMQKISDLAKSKRLPENFHLLLGSFAVLTHDRKVINVVPHIQCGTEPKINLVVKNNPSIIDPVYSDEDGLIPNVDIRHGDDLKEYGITINGKPHQFTFNTAVECITKGNKSFYCCIDICADHFYEVARESLIAQVESDAANTERKSSLPTVCSQVIISNTVKPVPYYCFANVTHCDPVTMTPYNKYKIANQNMNVQFTSQKKCSLLPIGNALHLPFVFSKKEFIELLKNKLVSDIFQNGDYIRLKNNKMTLALFFKDGSFESYPDGIKMEIDKIADLLFPVEDEKISAYKGIFLDVFQTSDTKLKQRPDKTQVLKAILTEDVNVRKDADGSSAAWLAARDGDQTTFQLLINNAANLDIIGGPDLTSPLHEAAKFGHTEIFKLLCDSKASIKVTDRNGRTAAHHAAAWDKLDILAEIAKKDPEMLHDYTKGLESPLHFAARGRNLRAVEMLIESKVDINKQNSEGDTPLHLALRERDFAICELLLEKKANINLWNNIGENYLLVALEKGLPKPFIDLLMKKNASANQIDPNGNNALLAAIGLARLDVTKQLIDMNADVNLPGVRSITPLNWVANCRKVEINKEFVENKDAVEIAKLLIEKNADIDAMTDSGDTPALAAIKSGNINVFKYLMEQKANLHIRNKEGHSTLSYIVSTHNLKLISDLVESKLDLNDSTPPGSPAIYYAISCKDLDTIRHIISLNAGINQVIASGLTPLHWAVQYGTPDVFKLLMDNNANIDSLDANDLTPIHLAAKYSNTQIIAELAKNNPESKDDLLNIQNSAGDTPLHMAVPSYPWTATVIKCLIENKANIDQVNNNGETAAYLAVRYNNISCFKYLIELNANIHIKSNNEYSPLSYLIATRNLAGLSAIFESKIDINQPGPDGKSAIHYAIAHGFVDVLKHLISIKANVNLNGYESTPLHFAAKFDNPDIFRVLLENKANIYRQDDKKLTPVHTAVEYGHYELIPEIAKIDRTSQKDIFNSDEHYPNIPPLHFAVNEKRRVMMLTLIENKAHINKPDSAGNTPLHLAYAAEPFLCSELIERKADLKVLNADGKSVIQLMLEDVVNGKKDMLSEIPKDMATNLCNSIQKAAEDGSYRDQYLMGLICMTDWLDPVKETNKAFKWFAKSIDDKNQDKKLVGEAIKILSTEILKETNFETAQAAYLALKDAAWRSMDAANELSIIRKNHGFAEKEKEFVEKTISRGPDSPSTTPKTRFG